MVSLFVDSGRTDSERMHADQAPILRPFAIEHFASAFLVVVLGRESKLPGISDNACSLSQSSSCDTDSRKQPPRYKTDLLRLWKSYHELEDSSSRERWTHHSPASWSKTAASIFRLFSLIDPTPSYISLQLFAHNRPLLSQCYQTLSATPVLPATRDSATVAFGQEARHIVFEELQSDEELRVTSSRRKKLVLVRTPEEAVS